MKRRQFLAASAFGAFAPRLSFSQQRKPPLIGVLHVGSSTEPSTVQREPFERGLRELGWAPGSTLIIDYRYAEGDLSKLPSLANELVRAGAVVLVARADAAINAARNATSTIPIVMSAYVGDPAAAGVVKNLSRPGGNVTGIGNFLDLDGKRLEILKDAFPKVHHVGVITNPTLDGAQSAQRMANLSAAASALKMQLQVFDVRRREQIPDTFAAIRKSAADAILVRGDPDVLDSQRVQIASHAAKLRLPAIYWWRFMVEAGGLMSYGNSISGFHYRSATYVDRILKGAKAADLPIEQPTKVELVLNMKAAKALGVAIPKAVEFRADAIIQ